MRNTKLLGSAPFQGVLRPPEVIEPKKIRMRNLVILSAAAVLLSSSVSFADPVAPQPVQPEIEHQKETRFECRFDVDGGKAKSLLACIVRGRIKNEREEAVLNEREHQNRLTVECNNGFSLFDRRAAVKRVEDDLWINGDEGGRIATLLVREDRDRHDGDRRDVDRAILVVSSGALDVARLMGRCEFREHHNDSGDDILNQLK